MELKWNEITVYVLISYTRRRVPIFALDGAEDCGDGGVIRITALFKDLKVM